MLQKSRKITILMLAILIAYSIIANCSLVDYGFKYYFIVNPLFWLVYICIIKLVCSESTQNSTLNRVVTEYTLIASFIYIGIYLVSELFVEIGENPYSLSAAGLIINFFVYLLPIIAKEYIRFRLINNVFEKNKKEMAILITIVYILIDIGNPKVFEIFNLIELLFSTILPSITINIMCSCIAYNKMWKQSVLYRVITFAFWLLFPILPKDNTWILSAAIDTVIPLITVIYLEYYKSQKENAKKKKDVEVSDPKSIVILIIVVTLVLWFAMGLFPIKPIAIATGSMQPSIMVGDVVILKKCNSNDVDVGDIVQYQKDDITVVHRIVSKYYEDGMVYFIFKGDNNNAVDMDPVAGYQIMAKELFSIRYIGFPSIWINRLNTSKDKPSVETGK